jgi:hypothetical protein
LKAKPENHARMQLEGLQVDMCVTKHGSSVHGIRKIAF